MSSSRSYSRVWSPYAGAHVPLAPGVWMGAQTSPCPQRTLNWLACAVRRLHKIQQATTLAAPDDKSDRQRVVEKNGGEEAEAAAMPEDKMNGAKQTNEEEAPIEVAIEPPLPEAHGLVGLAEASLIASLLRPMTTSLIQDAVGKAEQRILGAVGKESGAALREGLLEVMGTIGDGFRMQTENVMKLQDKQGDLEVALTRLTHANRTTQEAMDTALDQFKGEVEKRLAEVRSLYVPPPAEARTGAPVTRQPASAPKRKDHLHPEAPTFTPRGVLERYAEDLASCFGLNEDGRMALADRAQTGQQQGLDLHQFAGYWRDRFDNSPQERALFDRILRQHLNSALDTTDPTTRPAAGNGKAAKKNCGQ